MVVLLVDNLYRDCCSYSKITKVNFPEMIAIHHLKHDCPDLLSVNTSPKCNNNSETTKTTDVLDTSQTSSLDDSVNKSNLNVSSGSADSGLSNDGVRPTDQLTYLAQILGFKVRKRLHVYVEESHSLANVFVVWHLTVLSGLMLQSMQNLQLKLSTGLLLRLPQRQPRWISNIDYIINGTATAVPWCWQ